VKLKDYGLTSEQFCRQLLPPQTARRHARYRSPLPTMTAKRTNACEVAVIGAGPYGLSIAAHLAQAGVSTRVLGKPMSFWRDHMPKGMRLRSPWRATHISDRNGALSLDTFAIEHNTVIGEPLSLERFVAYGTWFQQRALPDIDPRTVRLVEATGSGFKVTLADDEIFTANRVVIATGLANQDFRPSMFRDLPAALMSHSCEHADFAPFCGKHVAVVGRGQSACESAALLAEAGAEVELICRDEIRWLGTTAKEAPTQKRASSLREKLSAPSAVGPFPLDWLVELPAAVYRMPPALREQFTKRCLKAGAAGWLKPRFTAVKCLPGRAIVAARRSGHRIVLDLDNGSREFDHVVLGTGYRVDLARIRFLSPQLVSRISCTDGSPLLWSGFESSVSNLHFAGSYAVKSFGPLMRFIAGAPYTARAVTAAALVGPAPLSAVQAASVLATNAPAPQ
jgi:Pyridine nucleotide-disulphide oxidoreductase